jgi:hypothetical protein
MVVQYCDRGSNPCWTEFRCDEKTYNYCGIDVTEVILVVVKAKVFNYDSKYLYVEIYML